MWVWCDAFCACTSVWCHGGWGEGAMFPNSLRRSLYEQQQVVSNYQRVGVIK